MKISKKTMFFRTFFALFITISLLSSLFFGLLFYGHYIVQKKDSYISRVRFDHISFCATPYVPGGEKFYFAYIYTIEYPLVSKRKKYFWAIFSPINGLNIVE